MSLEFMADKVVSLLRCDINYVNNVEKNHKKMHCLKKVKVIISDFFLLTFSHNNPLLCFSTTKCINLFTAYLKVSSRNFSTCKEPKYNKK